MTINDSMMQPKYKMQRDGDEAQSLDLLTALSSAIFEALSLIQKALRAGRLTIV
jgi:hypothetical protein